MFRPKKHIKLDPLSSTPSIDDLKRVLAQVQKVRDCTVELPWTNENFSFALAVRVTLGSEEPMWTLYEGSGSNSHVLWNAPFSDLHLLRNVITLSIAEIVHPNIKEALAINPETRLSTAEPIYSQVYSQELSSNTEELNNKNTPSESRQPVSSKAEPVANQSSIQPRTSPTSPNIQQQMIPGQNYPFTNPNDSGSFPALAGGPNQPSPTYAYFYPGYPYPIPMPYPPIMPIAQPTANTVPIQPGTPVADPNKSSSNMPAPDIELLKKQTSYMVGQFLVDSGLIPEPTLKASLKLQEMVAANIISKGQAIETISRIHHRGGNLDIVQLMQNSPTSGNKAGLPKQSYPLLGNLLVKAEVIDPAILEAVLKMQEIVRSGAISKDEACQAITKELAKAGPKITKAELAKDERVMDLLAKCGLVSSSDIETVQGVRKKHGGRIDQILVAAGKLSAKTYAAAVECESMLYQEKIKLEQAIIALNYCERSRIDLKDAFQELGFEIN